MKGKWTAYVAAGIVAAGILGGGQGAFAPLTVCAQEAADTETEAETQTAFDAVAYAKLLCGGDTARLESDYTYTEDFMNAIEASGGFAALQESLKALGALKETEEPVTTEVSGYAVYEVPCKFEQMNLNLQITLDGEGKIAGVVTMEYQGEEAESLPEGLTETELNLSVSGQEGWVLPGTLTMPEGDGPFPAVVLVHGSGPNDRDETIGPNKPFRDLAWGLAQQGIAVYRYDKRTMVYGQEMAADTGLTLDEETVEDAKDAVALLRSQEKIDTERVYVLGHSLGGEALPRIDSALADGEKAAGYIFMAAPARDLAVMTREQYDFLYSFETELDEEAEAQKQAIYEALDKLDDLESLGDDEAVMGAYKAYWEDLKNYDPVESATDMTAPCLVLQGEEDYQVTMEDYNLWKAAFGEKEGWEFHSYPGITHLFMAGDLENGNADYMKQQKVDEAVIADIAAFIKK